MAKLASSRQLLLPQTILPSFPLVLESLELRPSLFHTSDTNKNQQEGKSGVGTREGRREDENEGWLEKKRMKTGTGGKEEEGEE